MRAAGLKPTRARADESTMPGAAHHAAGARRARRRRGTESGFSLIELIVVMILVAIALLAAIHTMTSIRRSSTDHHYQTAATSLWRGIGAYRQDHKGALPPLTALQQSGRNFTNVAGARYVRQWPDDPRLGKPLEVLAPSGSGSIETGPPNSVRYEASANGDTARLAAYGHDGRLLFLRSVSLGAPEAPVG